ncbi:MAG: efflux RND transporter periplasmic adaptor subunit [Flavobacteriaceae bacterium]|nr:efflux RND transporter periplasmic adaptor subunit [Flavobacteriaceae bacterium]
MSTRFKIVLAIIVVAFITILIWFGKKNQKSVVEYETSQAFTTTIVLKTVATGKVIPIEEINIVPQVSGIIQRIYVEEGAMVQKGDLIASIKIVPNLQSLNAAQGRVISSKLQYDNAKVVYERQAKLYESNVISKEAFDTAKLNSDRANQDLKNAKSDLEIIKEGSTKAMKRASNTNITAQISGTVLEIPIKVGSQVIESSTFNAGTTIATLADMDRMYFEGKVDESEVGKLKNGTELEVSIGAIEKQKFSAILNFIAPKGNEENGAVQFKIKANIELKDDVFIRAGYSANAEIVLEERKDIMAIKESLLRFDKKTDMPYVDIEISEGEYEKKEIELGISDGINVEVLSGITAEDKIKIWNKTSKEDYEDEDED